MQYLFGGVVRFVELGVGLLKREIVQQDLFSRLWLIKFPIVKYSMKKTKKSLSKSVH